MIKPINKRQLIFDLDTKVSEKILGTGYRKIYKDIELHLKQYGFEHAEGSGYISTFEISDYKLYKILDELKKKYPYITKCIKDMRVADVISLNSLDNLFEYDGTPGIYKDYYRIDEAIDRVMEQDNDNEIELDMEL